MIEHVQTRDALDRAIAEDLEATRVRTTLGALRQEAEAARAALDDHRRRHAMEEADVRALEGLSLTRVLSAVRGTRTGELDRERAEEVAARYAMRSALARLQHVEARAEEAEQRLARLGDTAARRSAALEGHAEAVRAGGGPGATELDAVCDELSEVRAQAREVAEARSAGLQAPPAWTQRRASWGRRTGGLPTTRGSAAGWSPPRSSTTASTGPGCGSRRPRRHSWTSPASSPTCSP